MAPHRFLMGSWSRMGTSTVLSVGHATRAVHKWYRVTITQEILRHVWRRIRWCNFLPVYKNRKQEDYKNFQQIYFQTWNSYKFLKPNVGPNTLPISRVCHNRSFQPLLSPHFNTHNQHMRHGTIESDRLDRNFVLRPSSNVNSNVIEYVLDSPAWSCIIALGTDDVTF